MLWRSTLFFLFLGFCSKKILIFQVYWKSYFTVLTTTSITVNSEILLKNINPPIGELAYFCRSFYSDSYTFSILWVLVFSLKNPKLVLRQEIFAINPSQSVNYSNFTKSCWVQLESQQLIPSFMDRLVQRGHVQKLLKRTSALVEFQVFSNRT